VVRDAEDELVRFNQQDKTIPIYSTSGDWEAILIFPHIFNTLGEWVGWVTSEQVVFDVDGIYVGYLSDEPRILRRRSYDYQIPRQKPPIAPERIRTPSHVPLPPFFRELPFESIDVYDDEPDRLHPRDMGEMKEDMD
jgi:hypothetical protein